MNKYLPYHGVRHKNDYENGEPLFFFDRAARPLKKKRHGAWMMELMLDKRRDDGCYCFGNKPCYGKRVPHVLYVCPHCEELNATHIMQDDLMTEYANSLICARCDTHLWIVFSGFREEDWDRLLPKEKTHADTDD